jgi:hypothetical protein
MTYVLSPPARHKLKVRRKRKKRKEKSDWDAAKASEGAGMGKGKGSRRHGRRGGVGRGGGRESVFGKWI